MTITQLPTAGTLTLSGTAVTANQTIAVADISNLVFAPAADGNGSGYANFKFKANDGVEDSVSEYTLTLDVTVINDQPNFTANPVIANEDAGAQTVAGWTTFSPGGGSDEAAQTATYTVSNIGNAALFATDPAVDANGQLTYTPAADANGTSTFDVAVQDNGGTANSGVDTSTTKQFTITVTPVNDLPTLSTVSKSGNEDADITFAATDFTAAFSDVDSDSLSKIKITSLPDNGTLKLNGTAVTANQEINAADLGNLVFTPNADFNGNVSFTWNGHDGTAYAASNATANLVITAVPEAPSITTTGTTNSEITGQADAGDIVTVFQDGTEVGTATADADGNWTFTATTDGTYDFTATAADAAGNTSTASAAVSLIVDTISPEAPSITTTGTTNSEITGKAEAGNTVTIFQDGTEVGTATADADGNWTFKATTDGTYDFTATAADAAGNTSTASTAVSLIVDTISPDAPTVSTTGTTNDNTPEITGTAEAGSTVNILQNGTSIGTATADATGNWTFTPTTAIADGTYDFTATAADAAGNTSTASTTSSLTVDTTGDVLPVAPAPTSSTPLFTNLGNVLTSDDTTDSTDSDSSATTESTSLPEPPPIPAFPTVDLANISFTAVGTDSADNIDGQSTSDVISGLTANDYIRGLQGSDVLFGNEGNDEIYGNQGADLLNGNSGADIIYSGQGNDIALGGQDNDLMYGDLGSDTLSGDMGDDSLFGGSSNPDLVSGDSGDLLLGGDGNDYLQGNMGNDSISGGTGNDTAYGGQGNDLIDGDEGADILYGDKGNDSLTGNADNDVVFGGEGNDFLWGGTGDDFLYGEAGNDTLIGNDGKDYFVIQTSFGSDTILDFIDGTDKIGLAGGLTFTDLSITGSNGNTLISSSNELLATLTNIDVSLISSADFTLMV